MDNKLLDAFPALDAATWEAIIAKELKGADPATLNIRLSEGIELAPFHVGDGHEPRPRLPKGTSEVETRGVTQFR
ncbi:MAG: hypothetical protein IPI41_10650 [Flavobacteriales bacterium]|nr:hypothetical protein [Flavobacteriales bacterium]